MNNLSFGLTAGFTAGFVAFLPLMAGAQQQKAPKPNVVFIMSDQHNANALGCYGNREIKTPALDRLASEGMLFTRAYCQTGQSVPSRYSIFTGRYARSTGTYANGNGQDRNERTVADLFKPAGYTCATIGKHHMEMAQNQNLGFDLVLTPTGGHTPENPLPREEVSPGRSPVGKSTEPNERHTCGLTAQATIDFIRENKEHPFVVWCSFVGPHTPIVPSAPWATMYDPKKLTLPPNHGDVDNDMPGMAGLMRKSGKFSDDFYHNKCLAYYYGLVSQIDYNIGLILDELDKLGLAQNTIVIYTADHGEMMSEHMSWTKGNTGYESTIRVPYILRYPGMFEGGETRDEMVCLIDLLPTLLDASGLNIPNNIQGRSLVPLTGKDPEWREYIFTEMGANTSSGTKCVRGKDFKYVFFPSPAGIEYEQLFDVINDPWETKNLASDPKYASELARMKSVWAQWEAETTVKTPVKSKVEGSVKNIPAAQKSPDRKRPQP